MGPESDGRLAIDDDGRPTPTLLTVQNGRLTVIPGDPTAPRPVVEPGPHVKVWVNGALVERPRPVEPGDQVVAEAETVEPRVVVSVRLSEDFMKAYLVVERIPGRRFVLIDAPPSLRLKVQARLAEEIQPPLPTLQDIQQALEQAQVRFGIKQDAIERALTDPPPQAPLLVAEGVAPVPPQDGRLTIRFQERQVPAVDLEAERIDLFDRGAVTWVEPGEVLAVIEPPREGIPGTDVRGRTIPVPKPRPVAIKAGKGCRISDDGTHVVAVEPGRPRLAGDTLEVVPVFEVKGDADVSTGHIRFAGDVHVRGDVLEGLHVQAGGEVRVGGLVSHARISAGGNVIVGRTVIASRIEAGSQAVADVQELLPVLSPLCGQLQSLLAAARELREQIEHEIRAGASVAGGVGLELRDGELVKRLIERKFWDVPRLARELGRLGQRLETLHPGGRRLAQEVARMLVGVGPLRISGLSELAELASQLRQALDSVEGLSDKEADVMAYSVQNAHIQASGRIIIRGSGAFNSTLLAGRGLEARRGVVRGGLISVAEGDVMVRELGGPTGVPTTVVVARRGKIVASLVHPHVTISIGGQKHTFPDGARSLRAYLSADGTLTVEHRKAELYAHDTLADGPGETGQEAGPSPGTPWRGDVVARR